MHRHRKVWPIVRSSCASSRSAATAARTKPRPVDNSVSRPDTLRKWALPPREYLQPAFVSAGSSRPFRRESLQLNSMPEQRAASHSPPPPPFPGSPISVETSNVAKPSGMARRTVPPAQGTNTIPEPTPPSLRSTAPRFSPSAAANATNKWARSTFGSRKPVQEEPHNVRPPRSDPRLQRGLAPHQDPAAERSYRKTSFAERVDARQTQSRRSAPIVLSSSLRSLTDSSSSTRQSTPHFKARETLEGTSTLGNTAPCGSNAHKARCERPNRTIYKERGSLLSRIREDEPLSASAPNQEVQRVKKNVVVERKVSADVYIPSTASVGTLARLLGVRLERLQHQMRLAGMAEEADYDHVLTSDYAILLAEEFGRNPIVNDEAAFDIYPPPPHSDPASLKGRPPVVSIMGHVDHGKTTLLDNLRLSSVAKGEAGGITQHIGAFSVPVPASVGNSPKSITFLDTPGHAAFSAMRARGAGVTDIVVLVVAADDGIMPQTKEVINLIKKDEEKIGVVVAINKVDKPGIDVDAIQKALLAENIQLEVFGGDIPSVEVSGLTGHGLSTLVETLSAVAEMQDLRAERDGPIHGYVLESKVHKGLGPVATILLLRGCLKPGSHIISGLSHAKVRVMNDSMGASVKAAYPGMAITVSGWKSIPNAGDEVLQGTEAEVKKAVANRQRKAEIEATLVDVEAINSSRRQERERRELALEHGETAKDPRSQDSEQGPKELRLIIKADVSGSAEAVQGALQGIGNKEAITRIVSFGVGDISESDVMMAKAIGATIVGFSVSTPRAVETLAARNDVPIILSDVIYRLMEIVKDRIISLLPVVIETRVTGEAAVLQLFDIQVRAKQTKKVAGCRVTNGIVEKAKFARLVRNGHTIHEGMLDTMRILKKDVTEVRKGSECGLCFGTAIADLQEGDIIQMFEKIEKPGVL